MPKEAGEILDGRDLMVYLDTSDNPESPTYEAQALATTHTVTWATETKERLTKDSPGGNPEKRITAVNVTIKTEALRAKGDKQRDLILDAMNAKKNVKLKYGLRKDEESSSDIYYEGMFTIDQLEETSTAGDDVTWTAQFSSSGAVEKKMVSAGG